MINLTPHAIVIQGPDGSRTTIAPSGTVARATALETAAGDHAGVPVVTRAWGAVTGLGDARPVLVSSPVLDACRAQGLDTAGVYAPDTGATAVRDDAGRIVAVTRLVAA
jgi:hypothetical protein